MIKYAIVPVEPTPEMDLACTKLAVQRFRDWPTNGELYKAMLASAPPSDLIPVKRELLEWLCEQIEWCEGWPPPQQIQELRALLSPSNPDHKNG